MVVPDSSLLFSYYGADVHTAAAQQAFVDHGGSLQVTELHRFEFLNALRLAVFRNALAEAEQQQRALEFNLDVANGVLIFAELDVNTVVTRAQLLSKRHTVTQGQRCMDILLVAAALELGADEFLSFDGKQRDLATAEGLRVLP